MTDSPPFSLVLWDPGYSQVPPHRRLTSSQLSWQITSLMVDTQIGSKRWQGRETRNTRIMSWATLEFSWLEFLALGVTEVFNLLLLIVNIWGQSADIDGQLQTTVSEFVCSFLFLQLEEALWRRVVFFSEIIDSIAKNIMMLGERESVRNLHRILGEVPDPIIRNLCSYRSVPLKKILVTIPYSISPIFHAH